MANAGTTMPNVGTTMANVGTTMLNVGATMPNVDTTIGYCYKSILRIQLNLGGLMNLAPKQQGL